MSDYLPLLKRVSRSFYLSLRLLPGAVRPTLSLAYLLARASDSVADSASAPVPLRVGLLRALPESCSPELTGLLTGLPPAEAELLQALPELLQHLESSPDRLEILEVWKIILSGQIFDLERFASDASPLTLEEAVRYTGLVAGCVGKFWTAICLKHVPRYSLESQEIMGALGYEFGCALQWVNILRDRHADAAAGRVYVTPENLPPALEIARNGLSAGLRYASLVRSRRLRAAALLPCELGLRTLELVEADPEAPRVKVGRGFVWRSLVRALWH